MVDAQGIIDSPEPSRFEGTLATSFTLANHVFVVREAQPASARPDLRTRRASAPIGARCAADLVSLMETFGETAISAVFDAFSISRRALNPRRPAPTAPLGRRLPLDKGAHGKVLTNREDVGYDDQELFAGVRAVAAPIVDARGRKIAVVMVVGFKERVDLRTLRRIGERCVSAGRALSQRIGAEAA